MVLIVALLAAVSIVMNVSMALVVHAGWKRMTTVGQITTPTPLPPPVVTESADSMARYAIDAMVRVTEMAIAPLAPPSQQADTRPPAQNMPLMAMDAVDDPRDPLEVFLGPDFFRTQEALIDMNDESPMGIPGLRPPEGY